MAATLKRPPPPSSESIWGKSHPAFGLYSSRIGSGRGWLAEALAAENRRQVVLEEVGGSTAGLTRLRDEALDAVLVSHERLGIDAVDLVAGYRAGGADEAIVVLGNQSEQQMAASASRLGPMPPCVCAHTTTTRNLLGSSPCGAAASACPSTGG